MAEQVAKIVDMKAPLLGGAPPTKEIIFLPQEGIRMWPDEKEAVLEAFRLMADVAITSRPVPTPSPPDADTDIRTGV